MPIHPLVAQLRFTRREFIRGLEGVSDADARRRLDPMNCLSWMVAHLANQEHRYWVILAQGKEVYPVLNERFGFKKPASTPPLEEAWSIWRGVTPAADQYLEMLTPEVMERYFELKGKPIDENIGTLLLRNIHHYWFHIGEGAAVRQMLGHRNLPQFVGDMTGVGYAREG
jgi:hypothetical protein